MREFLPGYKLSGTLTCAVGSINGTTAPDRPNRAGFGSGSFALELIASAWSAVQFGRAAGSARVVEIWGWAREAIAK